MAGSMPETRNDGPAAPRRLRLLISVPAMGGASLLLWTVLYLAAARLIH